MLARKVKLNDARILSSQQEKLQSLFQIERIELNKNNLLQCSPDTLKYLHNNNKTELLNSALTMLSNSDILEIVNTFSNKESEISCLASLSSSGLIDTITAIQLMSAYLQNCDANDIKDTSFILLSSLSSQDTNIDKIASLLKKGKGRRTLSNAQDAHKSLITLLGMKGIVTYSDLEADTIVIKM